MVKKRLPKDSTLSSRTNFIPDHICVLLDLCLTTIYFQHSEGFYRQKHGFAMGSPVFPIVANLYMEEVENRAVITFTGTAPSYWSRYVEYREVEAFPEHRHAVWTITSSSLWKMSEETVSLCRTHWRRQKPQHWELQKIYTHRSILAVRLSSPTEPRPTTSGEKEKEQKHIRGALKTCGYLNWTFVKTSERDVKI